MFYRFDDDLTTIDARDADKNTLCCGYINKREFKAVSDLFGFSPSCLEKCTAENSSVQPFIEISDDYSFIFLKFLRDTENGFSPCAAIFIKRNLMVVLALDDTQCVIRDRFLESVNKYPPGCVTLEKLAAAFFNCVISDSSAKIESAGNEISLLEETVENGGANSGFNLRLLAIKRNLLYIEKFHEKLIDISETLEENENEIFTDSEAAVSGFAKKAARLQSSAASLRESVVHLQEAFRAELDLRLNHTMNIFTVITAVFLPLTVIVGWYGMNFDSMPEYRWKYGYVFVIVLSCSVVALLAFFAKKRHWMR